MGYSWKAEIIRTDGTTSITFADGDSVTRTAHIGLSEEPQAVLELNTPTRAVLRVNNRWRVPAYNLMSSSCALWSSGSAGAIAQGMYVRVTQGGTVTHIGRIKKIEEGDGGVLVITSYDDLMQLGELRDQTIFFDNAVDRIGDTVLANGPNITNAFNSANLIEATLPHVDIISPLMYLGIVEPGAMVDESYIPGSDDMDTGDLEPTTDDNYCGVSIYRRALVSDFLKIRFRYCNPGASTVTATVGVWSATAGGAPSSLLGSVTVSCPVTGSGVFVTVDSECFPVKLTKGTSYCFTVTWPTDDALLVPVEWDTAVTFYYWKGDAWAFSGYYAPYVEPIGGIERELSSADYLLTEGSSTTTITVDYGETSITALDMSSYGKFLRVSYFYGKLPAEEIMEQIIERAGFTAARAASLAQGSELVGFYNTGSYSYLECLQELADIYEPTQGHQWAFMRDIVTSGLSGSTIRIGRRLQPWADTVGGGTYSDDPASLSDTKKVLSHALRHAFEAKVGTVRVYGQAFDGSPVFVELDDKLWSSEGSLVNLTGSPLMEIVTDSTVTTDEQAVRTAEAVIREEHQNHLEGPLTLQGLHPELWQFATAQENFGSSALLALTSPAYGLSAFAVVARQIMIGGKQTALDLDNLRRQNQSMLRRAMDKALRAESFAIDSMPATVTIPVRYASTLWSGYTSFDRIKLIRSDGTTYITASFGTDVIITDDNCSPDGVGYTHFAGYFPGNRAGGPTSYKYTGGTASIHQITQVALGNMYGTYYTVTLPRPYWVWGHQAVLVDFYGARP